MDILLYIFSVLYCSIVLFAIAGIIRLRRNSVVQPRNREKELKVTLVVPFRNEADGLTLLARDLSLQTKNAAVEVIWVDDHSTDHYVEGLNPFLSAHANWQLISLSGNEFGKKAALSKGIECASGSIIVTTDGDVRVPPGWLDSIATAFQQQKADMMIMPLRIDNKGNSASGFFQVAENLAIQGLSFGLAELNIPIACNGANLAFLKSSFMAVGGYSGHQTTASGDDVLLMHNFIQKGLRVVPLHSEDVLVTTSAAQSWISAFIQRVRWAGKTGRMILSMAAVVGCILLLNSLFLLMGWMFTSVSAWILLLLLKVTMDLVLIKTTETLYRQRLKPLKLVFIAIAYVLYLPLITFVSAVWKPAWKGRKT